MFVVRKTYFSVSVARLYLSFEFSTQKNHLDNVRVLNFKLDFRLREKIRCPVIF